MRIMDVDHSEKLFAQDNMAQASLGEKGTVDGRNLKFLQKGDAEELRKKGNKQAVRRLVEQMQKDVDAQLELEERQMKQEQYASENSQCMECIKENKAAEEAVLETGSVSMDDISAGDISLMVRSINRPDTLTKEDKERLASFSPDKEVVVRSKAVYQIKSREIHANNFTRKEIGKSIEETKVELEKTHGMTDAKKEAESILEHTEKSILSEARTSGMEQIEKKQKEEEEKAKEQQQKEEDSGNGETLHTQELQQQVERQELIQNKVLKIKEEELLIDEDLIGLTVDDTI